MPSPPDPRNPRPPSTTSHEDDPSRGTATALPPTSTSRRSTRSRTGMPRSESSSLLEPSRRSPERGSGQRRSGSWQGSTAVSRSTSAWPASTPTSHGRSWRPGPKGASSRRSASSAAPAQPRAERRSCARRGSTQSGGGADQFRGHRWGLLRDRRERQRVCEADGLAAASSVRLGPRDPLRARPDGVSPPGLGSYRAPSFESWGAVWLGARSLLASIAFQYRRTTCRCEPTRLEH